MKPSLNFGPALKKISKRVNPSASLSAPATKFLGQALNEVNDMLVSRCLRSKGKTITVAAAENAVNSILEGAMKRCAALQGKRVIFLYNCGTLRYEPKTKAVLMRLKEKEKAKKMKKDMGLQFKKGLTCLTKLVFPEMKIHMTSKQLLCRMLGRIAKKISDEAKSLGQKQNKIGFEEMKAAAEATLPDEMLKHALAEGSKMVFYLENGRIPFHPTRKRVSVVSAKRKKVSKSSKRKKGRKITKKVSKLKKRKRTSVKGKTPRGKKRKAGSLKKESKRKRQLSMSKPLKKRKISEKGKKKHVAAKTVVKDTKREASGKRKVAKKVTHRAKKSVVVRRESKELRAVSQGIKKVLKLYPGQTLSTGALKLISNSLEKMTERIAIAIGESSMIGAEEIRKAVISLFPKELKGGATAHLSATLVVY